MNGFISFGCYYYHMTNIKNEESLLETLLKDVKECGKEKVVLQAGHFPLIYREDSEITTEAINHWGEFSQYTLELACKVGQHAQKWGKKIEFVFFVDDHSYGSMSGLNSHQRAKRRKRLYELRSGEQAELPEKYSRIMQEYEFDEQDVLRQDHKKSGRENCLYFSELILRASNKDVDNACAREYVEFVEDRKYFDKEKSHLVSFVPQRCRGYICKVALDEEIEDLSASHIFMESMAIAATRMELYLTGRGTTYRKDQY